MPTVPNPYRQGLDANAANHVALTPIDFAAWAADVFPERVAIIHGALRQTWAQTFERARRFASALAARDIGAGDTVSVLLPNTPAMIEAHFAVPMTRAVLNTINTRLDAATVAFILAHSQARVLVVDREFAAVAAQALAINAKAGLPAPFVVDVDDPEYDGPEEPVGATGYEAFLAEGDPAFEWLLPEDEWDAIALNYTSGTTGRPKGVLCHHRGAYLNAIGNVLSWGLPRHPVYLWTLPMFHCNGWCFPWTLALQAGVSVCLRKVDPALIFSLIAEHRVT
ncbi:MAG: AMP-binding protein, partial [Gammaproteobacteria bacterium]